MDGGETKFRPRSASAEPKFGLSWGGMLWKSGCASAFVLLLIFILPIWVWYWWRIEPEAGQFAVLIKKTGKDLPPSEILATSPETKGIQLEILPEGRYFRNPYTWDWSIHPVTDIPAGKMGVKVRLYGSDLPDGKIIATDDCKGIMPDVLSPGKYRINPYAFDVIILDAVQIRPGYVGVVTSLVGNDILNSDLPKNERNTYLVGKGIKGVMPEVLDPGTYYLNPYMFGIVEVNLQSQRFEVGGDDAILFLSQDGFPIRIEGTLEFNISREKAAILTQQVGDLEDIINKIILPRMRGFSRIEGSKKKAVDFIVGETRQQFQNSLEEHLRKNSSPWGVSVNSVLIRNIIPPEEIAMVIRERELAVQDARKFEQQIGQAKSSAELVRQEMLAEQNSRKVKAETERLRAEIAARQNQSVGLLAANRELDVAKIDLQATEAKMKAELLAAEAERDVIKKMNEAETAVLSAKIGAFGGGDTYARYMLYQKIAPRLESILANDSSRSFGLPLPEKSKKEEGLR